MSSSKLKIQMLKQSRRLKGFLTKRSSKVPDCKGEALPGMYPWCFFTESGTVFSLLPTAALFRQVLFCFVLFCFLKQCPKLPAL